MTLAKSYKSNIKTAIHETASDLYEVDMIDKQTMRRFDESCLTAVQISLPRKSEPYASVRK